MKRSRVPILVAALAGVVLAGAIALFQTSPGAVARRERERALEVARGEGALAAVAAAPEIRGLLIEAFPVRRSRAPIETEVSGVTDAARTVVLAAEVAGRVIDVPVEEHQRVDAGALLVRLEPTLLRASVARAEASLLRAEAAHVLSVTELERQEDLAKREFTSAAELDRAANQERAAFAALREVQAELDEARVRLAKTRVRAPFGGVLNRLDLEPGAYLRPGDTVAELLDLSEIEVEFSVTDREVVALREDDAIRLQLDAFPGEWFEGSIVKTARAADDETQKYPVLARVPNTEGRLLAGMLGRVRFSSGGGDDEIRIPRRAIQREFELDYVFVLEADGDADRVSRRRVVTRAVPFRLDLVHVVEGLVEGERVAVSSVRELRDGMNVRPRGEGS